MDLFRPRIRPEEGLGLKVRRMSIDRYMFYIASVLITIFIYIFICSCSDFTGNGCPGLAGCRDASTSLAGERTLSGVASSSGETSSRQSWSGGMIEILARLLQVSWWFLHEHSVFIHSMHWWQHWSILTEEDVLRESSMRAEVRRTADPRR